MRQHLISLAMLTILTVSSATAWSQDNRNRSPEQDRSTLVVSGQGEVMARPDRTRVRLGAEAQAPTAAEAQSQVNAIMQRALQQIRAVGIEERRIQTTGLQLFPVYERQRSGDETAPRVVAYRASNTVQVEVENLPLVGRVIDAGMTAGANRIESIDFDLRDDQAAQAQALQRAVAEARAKAVVLASAADVRLVGVQEVREGNVNIMPPPRPYGDAVMMRAEAATPIQPGELRVQASVTIRYRIAPR